MWGQRKDNMTITFDISDRLWKLLNHDELRSAINQILTNGEQLMSKITDFVETTNSVLADTSASLNNIAGDVSGLKADIQALKDQIAAGGSNLTPEDQQALDGLLASATSLAMRANQLAGETPDHVEPPTA